LVFDYRPEDSRIHARIVGVGRLGA
jgi:hypothetical protein